LAKVESNLTQLFAESLHGARPGAKIDDLGYAGFADSLVEGLDADRLRQVFATADTKGPGSRQPRLYAAQSPVMILANTMAPWLDNLDSLAVRGQRGYRDLRFEIRMPAIGGDGGLWLPGLLISPSRIVGIESETTDYLSGHRVSFSEQAEAFWTDREENGWRREMSALQQGDHGYSRLDAARLIKQYMGLRTILDSLVDDDTPSVPGSLLYLYWEPLNAARYEEFDEHHKEIELFQAAVADSDIDFVPMSYLDLWASWSREDNAPKWLAMHVARLHQRYSMRI
jgi:hypothetical protein